MRATSALAKRKAERDQAEMKACKLELTAGGALQMALPRCSVAQALRELGELSDDL